MAQRPRRTPKPPPLSYWEEFVETDSWYRKKIIEDVPEEELHAALVDEDYAPGEGAMSGDETEGEEDETEGEADEDYAISEVHSESEDEDDDDDDGTDSDGTSLISYFSHSDSDNEEVLGSSEGECGSEGEDGEGASGTVGEGGPGDAKVTGFSGSTGYFSDRNYSGLLYR